MCCEINRRRLVDGAFPPGAAPFPPGAAPFPSGAAPPSGSSQHASLVREPPEEGGAAPGGKKTAPGRKRAAPGGKASSTSSTGFAVNIRYAGICCKINREEKALGQRVLRQKTSLACFIFVRVSEQGCLVPASGAVELSLTCKLVPLRVHGTFMRASELESCWAWTRAG